jgi:hypothetical protein
MPSTAQCAQKSPTVPCASNVQPHCQAWCPWIPLREHRGPPVLTQMCLMSSEVSLSARQGTVAFPSSSRALREHKRESVGMGPELACLQPARGGQGQFSYFQQVKGLVIGSQQVLRVALYRTVAAGESAPIFPQWASVIPCPHIITVSRHLTIDRVFTPV